MEIHKAGYLTERRTLQLRKGAKRFSLERLEKTLEVELRLTPPPGLTIEESIDFRQLAPRNSFGRPAISQRPHESKHDSRSNAFLCRTRVSTERELVISAFFILRDVGGRAREVIYFGRNITPDGLRDAAARGTLCLDAGPDRSLPPCGARLRRGLQDSEAPVERREC